MIAITPEDYIGGISDLTGELMRVKQCTQQQDYSHTTPHAEDVHQ